MSNARKPVIGVISCTRTVEGEDAYIVKTRYVDAVARYADAVPVICPVVETLDDARAMVDRLDGILLTGSNSNIESVRYGAIAGRGPFDPTRDWLSAMLIEAAMDVGKPVFGICRGLQEINVALGGTLVDQRDGQDQPDFAHHAADGVTLDEMFAHGHKARLVAGTPMASIVGSPDIAINSVHYQAIGTLGAGLMVNARADDGVVEAVSSSDRNTPILAVQWHPEWRPAERPHDLAFWRAIGDMARAQAAR